MSALFGDGFDGYDDISDFTAFGGWESVGGAPTLSTSVRTGSGKCYYNANPSPSSYAAHLFATAQTGKTLYIGLAVKRANSSGANASLFILTQVSYEWPQVFVGVNANGRLFTMRGTTLLATGTTVLAVGVWYYIEAKMLVHGSAGKVEVKLNGAVEVAEFTGNTQCQNSDVVARFHIGGTNAGPALVAYYDDLYIVNSDGSSNNTYLGEQIAEIITPTADSSVQWSRNTGASNFSAIDDTVGAPDDATTYLYDAVSGHRDEFGLSNLTGNTGAVSFLKVNTRAQKDDANAKSIKCGINSGGTRQTVEHALGVGYANYRDIFETSDGGSTAWTPTTVNAALSIIEVV